MTRRPSMRACWPLAFALAAAALLHAGCFDLPIDAVEWACDGDSSCGDGQLCIGGLCRDGDEGDDAVGACQLYVAALEVCYAEAGVELAAGTLASSCDHVGAPDDPDVVALWTCYREAVLDADCAQAGAGAPDFEACH